MLEVSRAANAFAGFTDPQAVVELGRALAVATGALAIFATFLLACEVLPAPAALGAAVATAVVPAMTVHARYFKEDIFALPFLLIALIALIETLKAPTRARSLMLGGAIGLAAAAKYVAFIALPFAVAFLLLDASTDRRIRLALSGLVTLSALAVFALIELPALVDYGQFQASLDGNLVHAAYGHDVPRPLSLTFGVFHLRQSLVPGLGWPLLILGLLGLATPWLAPPERRRPLMVISLFALLWYAAHEISPLRPYPGFARYMVPVAPLLVILAGAFIYELARRMQVAASASLAAAVLLIAALPALYLSLRINGPAQENPRSVISALDFGDNGRIAFDSYTRFAGPAGTVDNTPPDATTADIFVTSSFRYDRFADAGGRTQRGRTRKMAAAYAALFEKPYLEVTNGRPTYAFFNPVLCIVALDGDATRLQPIAAKLHEAAPGFGISLVNGSEVGRQ
jgi:hypothetical protein